MDRLDDGDIPTNELQLYGHSNSQALPSSVSTSEVQIHYIPIASPPTPAASPRPAINNLEPHHEGHPQLPPMSTSVRRDYLFSVLELCTRDELLFISQSIGPLLKRQFLFSLPEELVLHVLSFVDELPTLMNATLVNKQWYRLVHDESLWQALCITNEFDDWEDAQLRWREKQRRYVERRPSKQAPTMRSPERRHPPDESPPMESPSSSSSEVDHRRPFSFRRFFRDSFIIQTNWRRGGKLLHAHRLPIIAPDSGTVTSAALDRDWLVVGLANSMIKVYNARTGVLARTLKGHDSGVWGVCLVSAGGGAPRAAGRRKNVATPATKETDRAGGWEKEVDKLARGVVRLGVEWQRDGLHVMPEESLAHLLPGVMQRALGLDPSCFSDSEDESEREREGAGSLPDINPRNGASSPCFVSQGWGQPNAIIVSGGCDKVVRVWDLKSGQCIYALHGHVSTIRSLRVLHARPVAVTGSRDATLRVWDVRRGRCLRVLAGHAGSVRCLDVCGNRVVSGSYDATCRLWDIDTGACLHVLTGHFSQIYSVAFDGVRVASGGLDTSVRIWDAETGQCTALLQGHTALVCQLQLSPTTLATGGADGRVITFALDTLRAVHRLAAHDSSVTALQFDERVLVTGGNDGRVRVFDARTGAFVRELAARGEGVWKVVFAKETCAVMCKRAGKTVVEIWSMRPRYAKAAGARGTVESRQVEGF